MPRPVKRGRVLSPRLLTIGIVILALVVLIPAVFRGVTAIRSIEVIGNSYCSKEEVIASSGILLGESAFFLKADQVRERVNQNRYLEFVSVTRTLFPGSVVITVREHAPRAKLSWMGMLYILGENGVVLERTSEIEIPVHVPEIIGMEISGISVGAPVEYGVPGQEEAITGILDALDLQGVTGEVTEINVAAPDNLQFLTESGLQVILGDAELLPEKIALMRDTLAYVQTLYPGQGGILNVSSGKTADFRQPPQ